MVDRYTILWYDPGAWTGWALVRLSPAYLEGYFAGNPPLISEHVHDSDWNCGTFIDTPMANMDAMVQQILRWPQAIVGTEDFTLHKPNLAGREAVLPIGINFALEYLMRRLGRRLWYQMPGEKDTFTPERLRRGGYWREGMGTKVGTHGQEALSHAFKWISDAASTPAYREALLAKPQ
jgi:hypothetical protein